MCPATSCIVKQQGRCGLNYGISFHKGLAQDLQLSEGNFSYFSKPDVNDRILHQIQEVLGSIA